MLQQQAPGTMYATYQMTDLKKIDRKGKRVLKPVKDDPNKETRISFRCFKGKSLTDIDSDGKQMQDIWFGIAIGTNPDNTPKFRLLTISNQRIFNLETYQDALEWHMVRHWEEVKGSPNQNSNPRFEVYDEEVRAEEDFQKGISVGTAMDYVKEICKDEHKLRSFARLFGIDTLNNSPTVVKGLLATQAVKRPDRIIKAMENQAQTEILQVFHKAKQLGLITFNMQRGFMFKDSFPLGTTEEAAIVTLAKDPKMLMHINQEANREEAQILSQRGQTNTDPAYAAANLNAELRDNKEPNYKVAPTSDAMRNNAVSIERPAVPVGSKDGDDF